MKRILPISAIAAIVVVSFIVAPNQTYAAWWNPFSWFPKNNQTEGQKQPQNDVLNTATTNPQTNSKNIEETKEQNIITPPSNNVATLSTETIENLKAEIETLKTNLDNLYTAHNNLVNDYNALLESVKTLGLSRNNAKPVTSAANSAGLEKRVSNLEDKLNDVCGQVFHSSLAGISENKCPSAALVKKSLEYRIEKLESK